jgi:hypothetical protein
VDGKSLTERSTRLAGAGVDYAYERRLPRWGRHHGASPSSRSSGLAELHLFLVDVCVVALLPRGSFDVLHGAGGGPLGNPVQWGIRPLLGRGRATWVVLLQRGLL